MRRSCLAIVSMRLTHNGWRRRSPEFITTDQPDLWAWSGTTATGKPSGHSENRCSRSAISAVRSVLEIRVFAIGARCSSSREPTLSNVYYTLKRVDAFRPECIILFDGKAKSGADEAVHGAEYPADAPGKILVAARPRRRSRRAAGSHQLPGSSDGKSDPGIPREGRRRAERVRGRPLVRRITASRRARRSRVPFSLTPSAVWVIVMAAGFSLG
jgi:hypothetical protein